MLAEVEVLVVPGGHGGPIQEFLAEMRVLHVYRGRIEHETIRVPFTRFPIGACPRLPVSFAQGSRLLIGLAAPEDWAAVETDAPVVPVAIKNATSYRALKTDADPRRARGCIAELYGMLNGPRDEAADARRLLYERFTAFARQDTSSKELLLRAAIEGILSPSDADVLAAADWALDAVAPSRSRLFDDLGGLAFALLRERDLAVQRLRKIFALSDHPAFVVRRNARSAIHRIAQEFGLPYDSQLGAWYQVDRVVAILEAAEAE
ncbi:MAG: hypothetical protein AAGF47_01120 [Planctomycetota bacterium]